MLGPVLAPFVVAWLSSMWLASSRAPLWMLDEPNSRSLHTRPTPRTGGLAVLLAIAIGWLWIWGTMGMNQAVPAMILGAMLVAIVSLVDDQKNIKAWVRFLIHGIAAACLLGDGFVLFKGWAGICLTWVAIVWLINLYNFMDGIDGLAAGMAVIGFSGLTICGWIADQSLFASMALVVALSHLGFLRYNFPPARLFMGDVGAATTGFFVAALSLWGIHDSWLPWWLPGFVFAPFLVDATATLLRRMAFGEPFWQAHRSHYYQRLVQLGLGHRYTTLAEYALMTATGASGIILWRANAETTTIVIVLTAWGICFGLIATLVHRLERPCAS